MKTCRHPLAARRQHGVATLSVVMILFFILAMVAAYTNRTLIVDQRASANNLRGAMAMDAAEAGIEWALAQLNGPRVDLTCTPSNQVADTEFRARYLTLNNDDTLSVQNYTLNGVNYAYSPSCVASAGAWSCSCPNAAAPTPSLALPPEGLGQAFRVTFQAIQGAAYPAHAGTIGILSQGCSNLGSGASNCTSTAQVPQVDAVAQVAASVGLVRTLPYRSAAEALASAITAGTFIRANTIRVANTDAATGVTLHAGGAINIDMATSQLFGPPGSVAGISKVACDDALWTRRTGAPAPVRGAACPGPEPPASDRFFQSFFGMDTDNYRRQPGLKIVGCPVAGCTSADLTVPLAHYGGRAIWLDGDLTIDAAGTIGSAAQPVVLIVTGNLTINAAVNFYGLLYANAITWNAGAAAAVVGGAIVSETSFDATPSPTATVAYDSTILSTIVRSYGSFVRVPSGMQYF